MKILQQLHFDDDLWCAVLSTTEIYLAPSKMWTQRNRVERDNNRNRKFNWNVANDKKRNMYPSHFSVESQFPKFHCHEYSEFFSRSNWIIVQMIHAELTGRFQRRKQFSFNSSTTIRTVWLVNYTGCCRNETREFLFFSPFDVGSKWFFLLLNSFVYLSIIFGLSEVNDIGGKLYPEKKTLFHYASACMSVCNMHVAEYAQYASCSRLLFRMDWCAARVQYDVRLRVTAYMLISSQKKTIARVRSVIRMRNGTSRNISTNQFRSNE